MLTTLVVESVSPFVTVAVWQSLKDHKSASSPYPALRSQTLPRLGKVSANRKLLHQSMARSFQISGG